MRPKYDQNTTKIRPVKNLEFIAKQVVKIVAAVSPSAYRESALFPLFIKKHMKHAPINIVKKPQASVPIKVGFHEA